MTVECTQHGSGLSDTIDDCDAIAPASIGNFKDFARLWQLAFEATDDMISVLDMRHRIIAVNKAMAAAM